MSEHATRLTRTVAAVILAAGLVYVLAMLVPPYLQNGRWLVEAACALAIGR